MMTREELQALSIPKLIDLCLQLQLRSVGRSPAPPPIQNRT